MSALAIMVTRRCNMACAHCSVESGPRAGARGPSAEELLASVRAAANAGVRAVIVTGGEPMLRERVVLEIVRECRALGIATRITTNGFWGRTPDRARRTLAALLDVGLSGMTVSYDRFHAAFQGADPVIHIAQAAAERRFPIDVNVTRLADDEEIEDLVAPFADLVGVRLRFYDVQPVGAARELPVTSFRSEVEGFCSACGIPALTDDGRVTACNGPSYFSPPGNPLAIGSLDDAPLGELLARHRQDPILDTIRTEGPAGLRDTLRATPGFEDYPFRERYAGMCELCHQINSDPQAVAALRHALTRPAREAVRVARGRLIETERQGGSLSRAHANAEGAARIFLALACGETVDARRAERVLGRADLDWRARVESLIRAGLARPLLPRLADPEVARWAPALFGDRLHRAAVRDEARELEQRAALERLAAALRAAGGTGVVIGAGALEPSRGWRSPARAVATVSVAVHDSRIARAVRESLGNGSAAPPVSIRRSAWPGGWGPAEEPEAVPVLDPALEGLRTLPPSEMLVHALVAASARGLNGGLETSWDAWSALQAGADVARILSLVARLPAPRAFWVPARVIAERAGVPIPREILADAPDDVRQRRLVRIAARRWFREGRGSPLAEWSFHWAWPLLAAGSSGRVGRRIPAAAACAVRELPAAWRDLGGIGVAGAAREARRLASVWTSDVELR